MEKNGMLSDKSLSDFVDKKGKVKKAEYFDAKGFGVADKANKNKLKSPVKIKD